MKNFLIILLLVTLFILAESGCDPVKCAGDCDPEGAYDPSFPTSYCYDGFCCLAPCKPKPRLNHLLGIRQQSVARRNPAHRCGEP